MMKFKHKYTGEIVFVVGYYFSPKGILTAECLCDARLHPFYKKQLHNGSVFIHYPHSELTPVDAIDWESVNKDSYEEGEFERMVKDRFAERRKGIECSAVAIYHKEKRQCLSEGVPEDIAESIAQKKKAEFIEEKMTPPQRFGTPLKIRDSDW